jgi:hypothetical protein
MGRRTSPKTDFGTVILHWMLVALFVTCVITGLRITTVSPFDFAWIQALDGILPYSMVWTAHVPVAVALFGLAFAYAIYVRRAGLTQRIRPDRIRLMGLFRGGPARLVAINTILTWVILLTMLEELVTGYLVYLGYGGMAVELHRWGTWLLLTVSVGHVATHFAIGGLGQIARIFRPSRLPPVAPPFDPFDLLAAPGQPPGIESHKEPRHVQRRVPQHDVTLQSHPFAAAMMLGLIAMSAGTLCRSTRLPHQRRRCSMVISPIRPGARRAPWSCLPIRAPISAARVHPRSRSGRCITARRLISPSFGATRRAHSNTFR